MTEAKLLSEEAVAEIEARANAASSEPWLVTDGQHIDQYGHHPDGNRLLSEGSYDANYHMFGPNDVEFIAHAREDIPALCATVRALRAERTQMLEALERTQQDRNSWRRVSERLETEKQSFRTRALELCQQKAAKYQADFEEDPEVRFTSAVVAAELKTLIAELEALT